MPKKFRPAGDYGLLKASTLKVNELNWTLCSHSRNSFRAYLAPTKQPSAGHHCNNLNRELHQKEMCINFSEI